MHSGNKLTIQRSGFKHQHPALAKLYGEWYDLVAANLSKVPGIKLELGSGAGFLKERIPDLITSDVLKGANIDQIIEAKNVGNDYENQISNLILINVFHHINDSQIFLSSASAALKPGGRMLLIEPACNIWSKFIYKTLNHEPFNTRQENWQFTSTDPLLDSNQAQSWIVFNRDQKRFSNLFPDFSIIHDNFLMPISYILTGGHKFRLPAPNKAISLTRRLERRFLDNKFGLFRFLILEKRVNAN